MAYIRKTEDEYDIEGDYGLGYEVVTCETKWSEVKKRLKEYRENEPGTPFRWVKHRVPIAA